MNLSEPRILCVDDNNDTCELIELMLSMADGNYKVKTAASPAEALALIKTESFDLYILDYQFPNISGVELCHRIRELDSHTPIMFYTAMARPEDCEAALSAGANAYLVKPTGMNKLIETIVRLLSHQEAGQTVLTATCR